MFVAAWSFDIQWGSREEVHKLMKEFGAQSMRQEGWRSKRTRILHGSIGAPESRLVVEHDFESLADLEASWAALHKNADRFKQMVTAMKPHVVAGSPRWEIYRVVDEA